MPKKVVEEINLNSGHSQKSKLSVHKKRMSTVRCLCGFEILVSSDLKAMNRALKNHLAEHKQSGDAPLSPNSLEMFLTEQILIVASKVNMRTVN